MLAASGPNGFTSTISFGNKVSTASNAMNMASAVNTPNRMVGIKFEKTNMENPKIMVNDVYSTALPMLA